VNKGCLHGGETEIPRNYIPSEKGEKRKNIFQVKKWNLKRATIVSNPECT
jgi:hypothetical protein